MNENESVFEFCKAARVSGGVSCEKIALLLRSKPINRLLDNQSRIPVNKLANGFPTKIPNEWPTWNIKAVVTILAALF